jgi:hypothetical protein
MHNSIIDFEDYGFAKFGRFKSMTTLCSKGTSYGIPGPSQPNFNTVNENLESFQPLTLDYL